MNLNRSRLASIMPPEVINWLEERDRELENYLDNMVRNSVSITSVTQAIWTPAAHAPTHATAGSDPLAPGDIGAYTTAQVDSALLLNRNDSDALRWMTNENDVETYPGQAVTSLDQDALRWMDNTNDVETIPAVAAGGAHPDLAAHDLLGLATQAELDSEAAYGMMESDSPTMVTIPTLDPSAATTAAIAAAVADRDALLWMLAGP